VIIDYSRRMNFPKTLSAPIRSADTFFYGVRVFGSSSIRLLHIGKPFTVVSFNAVLEQTT